MQEKLIKLHNNEDFKELKTFKERSEFCKNQGLVYLGDGYMIAKEDYTRVILFEMALRYGEDFDRKEEE